MRTTRRRGAAHPTTSSSSSRSSRQRLPRNASTSCRSRRPACCRARGGSPLAGSGAQGSRGRPARCRAHPGGTAARTWRRLASSSPPAPGARGQQACSWAQRRRCSCVRLSSSRRCGRSSPSGPTSRRGARLVRAALASCVVASRRRGGGGPLAGASARRTPACPAARLRRQEREGEGEQAREARLDARAGPLPRGRLLRALELRRAHRQRSLLAQPAPQAGCPVAGRAGTPGARTPLTRWWCSCACGLLIWDGARGAQLTHLRLLLAARALPPQEGNNQKQQQGLRKLVSAPADAGWAAQLQLAAQVRGRCAGAAAQPAGQSVGVLLSVPHAHVLSSGAQEAAEKELAETSSVVEWDVAHRSPQLPARRLLRVEVPGGGAEASGSTSKPPASAARGRLGVQRGAAAGSGSGGAGQEQQQPAPSRQDGAALAGSAAEQCAGVAAAQQAMQAAAPAAPAVAASTCNAAPPRSALVECSDGPLLHASAGQQLLQQSGSGGWAHPAPGAAAPAAAGAGAPATPGLAYSTASLGLPAEQQAGAGAGLSYGGAAGEHKGQPAPVGGVPVLPLSAGLKGRASRVRQDNPGAAALEHPAAPRAAQQQQHGERQVAEAQHAPQQLTASLDRFSASSAAPASGSAAFQLSHSMEWGVGGPGAEASSSSGGASSSGSGPARRPLRGAASASISRVSIAQLLTGPQPGDDSGKQPQGRLQAMLPGMQASLNGVAGALEPGSGGVPMTPAELCTAFAGVRGWFSHHAHGARFWCASVSVPARCLTSACTPAAQMQPRAPRGNPRRCGTRRWSSVACLARPAWCRACCSLAARSSRARLRRTGGPAAPMQTFRCSALRGRRP